MVMMSVRLQVNRLASLLLAFACMVALGGLFCPAAAAAESAQDTRKAAKTPAKNSTKAPARTPAQAARAAPIPQGCARLDGVERKICVECDGIAFFKRIGCQQRVFWTTCKGKRLFEDAYCQMHQDGGPPRGEGN
jgi:hypothetical protein